ncbi:MAG: hypothetical protein WB424_03835, partial [Terracidiphilus sp.]
AQASNWNHRSPCLCLRSPPDGAEPDGQGHVPILKLQPVSRCGHAAKHRTSCRFYFSAFSS